MTKDLACLPVWYAAKGDYVFIDGDMPALSSFLPEGLRPYGIPLTREEIARCSLRLPPMKAVPWGLSRQSVYLFDELKRKEGLNIELPLWKDTYIELTARPTAAACLANMHERLPALTFPPPPVFFSQTEEIETYIGRHPGRFVLKTPYSSSGRGLLWLHGAKPLSDKDKEWIAGAISKQGYLSIEPALNKIADFAFEFSSDGEGQVCYEGLSLFATNDRGAYKGNALQSQTALLKHLSAYVDEHTLLLVQQALGESLGDIYGRSYAGYLGVDMLIHQTGNGAFGIHPCVEVNLRYTMGMLAVRLYENYLDAGTSAFLHILYDKTPGPAYARHLSMTQAHPPHIRNGKLLQGYLALCPVTEETQYTAYILTS
jgi:hypothetical protein